MSFIILGLNPEASLRLFESLFTDSKDEKNIMMLFFAESCSLSRFILFKK
jgi:hypothetical protein